MEESTGQPIDQLRQAIIAQKTVNLEESPDRPELAGLHNRLRAYDAFVSQLVITVLQGSAEATETPDRAEVERELERAQELTDPMAVREVRKYAQYKQRLDTMLSLAKQVVDQRRRQA